MRTYRYFEWTTAQAGHPNADQLMDALSDFLTEDGDVSRAMQMLMQRGMQGSENRMQGLRDMLEQLRKRKQQVLDQYDLNSLMHDLRQKLEQLLRQEQRTNEGQLLETTRANKAHEGAVAKQRGLDAASDALQAYLTGTQLADARRLASFQESRELLPYLVSPGQKYQAGLEAGGSLATAAGRAGLPFTPQALPKKTLYPGELAKAPSGAQIGKGIMQQIGTVKAAGK